MNNIYQLRHNISGSLLAERSTPKALSKILRARNPSIYTVYRLAPLTKEIKGIVNGKKWLSEYKQG